MTFRSDSEHPTPFREAIRILLRGLLTVTLPALMLTLLAGHSAAGAYALMAGISQPVRLGGVLWVAGVLAAGVLAVGSLAGARVCGLPPAHSATAAARLLRVWIVLAFWMALPAAMLGGLSVFIAAPLEQWLQPYVAERTAGFWTTLPARELLGGLTVYTLVVASWGLWLWLPAATLGLPGTPLGQDRTTAHRALQRTAGLEAWMLGLLAISAAALPWSPLHGLSLLLPVLWIGMMVGAVHALGEPFRRAGGPRAAARPDP